MLTHHVSHSATLEELEAVIERGLKTFMEVGQALLIIRDDRRYKEAGYETFDDYCIGKWGFKRQYATRIMRATETVLTIESEVSTVPVVTGKQVSKGKQVSEARGHGSKLQKDSDRPPASVPLPTSERQVRPLVNLPKEDQVTIWKEVTKVNPNPTSGQVEEGVNRYYLGADYENSPILTEILQEGVPSNQAVKIAASMMQAKVTPTVAIDSVTQEERMRVREQEEFLATLRKINMYDFSHMLKILDLPAMQDANMIISDIAKKMPGIKKDFASALKLMGG